MVLIMKIIISIFLLSFSILFSQILPGGINENYDKPITKSENPIYLGIGIKSAKMINDTGIETGIVLGCFLSKYISLDLNYYYLFTNNVTMTSGKPEFLRMDYYGLRANPYLPLFESVKIKANGGIYLAHASYGNNISFEQFIDLEGNWFFFGEFGLGFDVSIYDPIAVSLEGNYRIAPKFELKNYEDKSIEGLNLNLILKIEL